MKQHYIPRCYLRRFSEKERSIWSYDKHSSKSYLASLMSVCCEDDLYTISEEYLERNKDVNASYVNRLSIEKDHFANMVEPFLSRLISEIECIKDEWITGKDNYILNFYEKRELALHIVTQFFRMPQVQDATVDDYLRMEKAGMDMVKYIMAHQTGDDRYKDLNIKVECDKPVLNANLTYLNDGMLMNFADEIASNYWLFWVSDNNDFYTSDCPIVVSPHVGNVRPTYHGLSQYGGELTYPLSSNITLSIYDRNFFVDKKSEDCHFVKADDKEIRRQNFMRYFYATRHVFSFNNDFSLIDFSRKMNGGKHIFMQPNLKTEIVSGLGRY